MVRDMPCEFQVGDEVIVRSDLTPEEMDMFPSFTDAMVYAGIPGTTFTISRVGESKSSMGGYVIWCVGTYYSFHPSWLIRACDAGESRLSMSIDEIF